MKHLLAGFLFAVLALFATPAEAEAPTQPYTEMTPAETRVIDPINTDVARGYESPEFVGHHLFPTVNVDLAGGQVIEFGKEAFRRYNTRRARGGSTKIVRFGYAGAPYALEGHRLMGQVPLEDMRDASVSPGIDLSEGAIHDTMMIITREVEIEQAEIARNESNYDNDHKVTLSGSTQWSHADSKPAAQVRTGKEAIRASIGMYPDTLVISATAFAAAQDNPSIIERIKYTGRDSVTAEMLAGLLGVKKVVVGAGVYAADDDDASDFTDIWGGDGILAYTGNNGGTRYIPGRGANHRRPSYGYTYQMRGQPLVEQPILDKKDTNSWLFPVVSEHKAVLAGMSAGYLLKNIV